MHRPSVHAAWLPDLCKASCGRRYYNSNYGYTFQDRYAVWVSFLKLPTCAVKILSEALGVRGFAAVVEATETRTAYVRRARSGRPKPLGR